MNQHNIRKWKENVSPPGFRRGGSAHILALWHYLLAETGWLKQIPDGKFQPPPPNPSEYEVFQDIRLVRMDLGTPPQRGGEIFDSLTENKVLIAIFLKKRRYRFKANFLIPYLLLIIPYFERDL
jgi:hypothetical protein